MAHEVTEASTSEPEVSALRGAGSLIERINRARLELLDLSTRNRLLSMPRGGRARTVEVVNELAAAMYRILVVEGKRFTFEPGRHGPLDRQADLEMSVGEEDDDVPAEPVDDEALIEQPDLELDEDGRVVRHWDQQLSTRLTSAGLQKRLLDLHIDARTLQEEQGVNVLYLAVGYLKWQATLTPKVDRYAPLILVPVTLDRSNAGEKFHLKWSGDDIEANLSLQLFLHREHHLKLPDIADFESLDVDAYLASIGTMVEGKRGWEVLPNDAVLGLFSFAKFMMYRDLDPALWGELGGMENIPTLRGVVSDGFPGAALSDENANIDVLIPPEQMIHVVDCDSSQSLVVHDVRKGNSVVVQGPPGTGKSQTIANIISAAVADGKKVLFVAEKMAALEVVKRRLDHVEIGVACLELHSNKANKRAVLEELKRTWQLGAPGGGDGTSINEQLRERRDALNQHATRLHQSLRPADLTPYQVLGHLVRLRRLGFSTQRVPLEGAIAWAPHDKSARDELIHDLVVRIDTMGIPDRHSWAGVGIDGLLPNDRDRLVDEVSTLRGELGAWISAVRAHQEALRLPVPTVLSDVRTAEQRAQILLDAPAIGREALLAIQWQQPSEVQHLATVLVTAQRRLAEAAASADPRALHIDWHAAADAFRSLPPGFVLGREIQSLAAASVALKQSGQDFARLTHLMSETSPLTLDSALKLVLIAERATTIPEIDRDALVAHVWDRGVDAVQEIVATVERFQKARASLSQTFRETAWAKDLEEARLHLATRGGSWLRVFSADWRRSDREVRAQLVSPKLPADQMLAALDALLDAQLAKKKIDAQSTQALDAFGSSWQGERSDVLFLRRVVAWMRTLRPLGSGVRERLANINDRVLAAEVAKRLKPVLMDLQQTLKPTYEAMIAHGSDRWGEETILGRMSLQLLGERLAPWQSAFDLSRLLTGGSSLSVGDALEAIGRLRTAQEAVAALDETPGAEAFGLLWKGLDTDPSTLQAAIDWMASHAGLRELAAHTEDPSALLVRSRQLIAASDDLSSRIQRLFDFLQFQGASAIGGVTEGFVVGDVATHLSRWEADPEALPQWVAYIAVAKKARQMGLSAFVDAMASGELGVQAAKGTFELAYYETVFEEMVRREPALAAFDGQQQLQLIESFVRLDRERQMLARIEAIKTHHGRIPRRGGATGPTAVLMGEMEKKRAHMPIRQLMQRCAPAIQALKPVFMMSPLSVAQFLPPNALSFDMLVVDEASQVQPVDALGAIARARQLVVVGDERQLPPTRFFAKMLGDAAGSDEDGAQAADVESILGLCRARGLPERMLRWHYRSRHQSLIAVSNSQFYENKLFIVPSPYTSEAGVGLRFNHLPAAVYDRGNTRTNPLEAKAVARAVIAHARATPHMSLGVATFSTQQRRAIWDELELLRRQHPETEGFFGEHSNEPFFVKSLENIQGDERDVIYISVGYGRDSQNSITMNFGPVSREGGERRLNVLISRAKSRCEVFSSITDEDIDLERARGKGTAALKLFLRYARTGQLNAGPHQYGVRTSIFEEEVAVALRERGYDLHTHVGIAGFFVDIAVADPERPGRYVLGIECDGESYRDAKSARDRNRLRDSALRDKGWNVYRLWSSDWFQRPQAELAKLISAIEAAKAEPDPFANKGAAQGRAVPIEFSAVDRGEFVEVGLVRTESVGHGVSYIEASFAVPSRQTELHLVPAEKLATIVQQVVETEGPIHRAEIVTRVRTLWGLQRAGARIQAAVEDGIDRAILRGWIQAVDGDFVSMSNRKPQVRDRSNVASATLRRPDYLPPSEIDAGLLAIVEENLGASTDELVGYLSRQLGYRTTSAQLRRAITDRCELLLTRGQLVERDGVLGLPIAS